MPRLTQDMNAELAFDPVDWPRAVERCMTRAMTDGRRPHQLSDRITEIFAKGVVLNPYLPALLREHLDQRRVAVVLTVDRTTWYLMIGDLLAGTFTSHLNPR